MDETDLIDDLPGKKPHLSEVLDLNALQKGRAIDIAHDIVRFKHHKSHFPRNKEKPQTQHLQGLRLKWD